eukprot:CAMPEP_0174264224 /NCGR_PEP_ID=MMETSP0439-20130205/21760_1 /TAXON_ID=0 /ORGANISM="Stereomyxa ramosa, Strain Chinc5" /LENGTH=287 /DNA_ID=CAMNT_0015349997 /DNA_START=49 /DNA_END=912 /DNA_ORIENTATION=-
MLGESVKKQSHSIHENFNKDELAVDFTPPPRDTKPDKQTEERLKEMLEQGYVMIPDLLSPQKIAEIKAALRKHLIKEGRNNFEGYKTQRVYSIVKKEPALMQELLLHPAVISLLDNLLLSNYLLTANQAINITPGESHQPYHHDDQFILVPRPRQYFSVATIWAIDDFTPENGATHIFPKSHLWGNEKPTKDMKPIPAEMKAGSVVVFLGTLWHGGGDNVSNSSRMCVTFQYCEPYIRPQENMMLSFTPEEAKKLSPQVQSLVGYSIHPPFIGHVNGEHPLKQLAKL